MTVAWKRTVEHGDFEQVIANLYGRLRDTFRCVPENEMVAYKGAMLKCHCYETLTRFQNDLTFYMEACLITEQIKEITSFLITDDHALFKTFFWSKCAEMILKKEVSKCLSLKDVILEIQLAGNIIPGV